MPSTVFTGISQLVLPNGDETNTTPLRVIPDAFLWIEDGRIVAVGARADLPAGAPAQQTDLGGRAVIPGLVDSHTHVVFAGQRMDEMERRSRGEGYEDIARAGGGITRSVASLQAASEDEIVEQSLARAQYMLHRGTTTLEIKSGYGLHIDAEIKHLRAIAAMASRLPQQDVRITLLAHVVPETPRQEHVSRFVTLVQRAAEEKWAHHVDVFVEAGAFDADEARLIARAAQSSGLAVKLHVDQLRNGQGAALAAELGALSADHLEYTDAAGRTALAQRGVVATLLPGCAMFLGKGPWPDGRALRDSGAEVAVATDCNPGSSMICDLLLCASLAATRCGLTLAEALWAVTRGGAKALGLRDRGCLATGERADFVVLDHDDWRAALYYPGNAPIHAVAIRGLWV